MLNLTPHEITLRTAAGDITIPPSGTVARVATHSEPIGTRHLANGLTVPVVRRSFGAVEGLPSPLPSEGILVSGMVLEAIKESGRPDRHLFFAPDTGETAIRNERGHVVAVLALSGV